MTGGESGAATSRRVLARAPRAEDAAVCRRAGTRAPFRRPAVFRFVEGPELFDVFACVLSCVFACVLSCVFACACIFAFVFVFAIACGFRTSVTLATGALAPGFGSRSADGLSRAGVPAD